MQRVVITGVGVASSLGCNVPEFWERLLAGQSGVVSLEDDEFSGLPTRIGARVSGYLERRHFERKEVRRMSRTTRLALVAATQAVEAARLTKGGVNPSDVGVIIGSSIGGFSASEHFVRDYYLHGRRSPLVIPISMNNAPASHVSIRYGFQGPLLNLDAACASAAHSIGYAFNLIRTGMLGSAVCGGADSPFARGVMEAWCALRVLSERNDNPAAACRPFSADRDGMVLGEGAGILILEAESLAIRRVAAILAEVKGYGATGDGHHLTQPTTVGPARAMQKCLADAGLAPDQIDYINAHATGTRWNDRNETAAIKQILGARAYHVPVVGNKAALGHAIGASGALELISCVQSVRQQVVPPTINYRIRDPACDLDYATEGSRRCRIRNAMSNSFAFGGSNATLIVGEYDSDAV